MNLEEYIRGKAKENQPVPPVEEMWASIASKQKTPASRRNARWVLIMLSFAAIALIAWMQYRSLKQQQHIDNLTAMLETKFENASMMQKIKMVHLPDPAWKDKNAFVDVLMRTLDKDADIAVKIAAVEALRQHIDRQDVRSRLLYTLDQGQDAYLSIRIIHVLSEADIKESLPYLKRIVAERNQSYVVQLEATEAINKMT